MPYGSVLTDSITDSSGGVLAPSSSVFRNRILNGAMQIDQRNAGASVTNIAGTVYCVDRWGISGTVATKFTAQQNAGSVTPPTGFKNYLGITSSSAYTVGAAEIFLVRQPIEGFNVADLAWGTASAATVTVSFWVRSSLTGTFGGAVGNNAGNRSYPFTYTINSANTWEKETITIAGDTSGTWTTDNTGGLWLYFGLGVGSTYSGTAGAWAGADYRSATGATSVVGTNGATFYITGVQLEKGTTATSFDYRPYGTELALCQRYYQRSSASSVYSNLANIGTAISTTQVYLTMPILVSMRSAPSVTSSSTLLSADGVNTSTVVTGLAIGSSTFSPTEDVITLVATVASGLTQYRPYYLHSNNNSSGAIQLSSEL
jgi:hypothetical protein